MRTFLVLALLTSPAAAQPWRPYQFSVEANTLSPKRIVLESGVGYNGLPGAGRGLSVDSARSVGLWIGSAFGVVDRLELGGAFQFGDDPTGGFGFNQARLEARVRVLGPWAKAPVAISIGAGYAADALVHHALTALVAVSATAGRVHFTFNLRGAHYFAPGRDPLDVFISTGVLVRVVPVLHLGVEYVGEELEALVEPEEFDVGEGGRHFVGPTAALVVGGGRVRIGASGGVVVMGERVGPQVRGSLAYLF
jgi:hypothetical protein